MHPECNYTWKRSQQYFLWCCVQQQMYHYQLLSTAFASYGFEPPRIPGAFPHHIPPIFNGSMKCLRDREVFNQSGFLYVNVSPDTYQETRQEAPVEQRNQWSEKSKTTSKKSICKVLFECTNSSLLENAENRSIFSKQGSGSHVGENSKNPSEDSGQSGRLSQNATAEHNVLEKHLQEEYQMAKNTVNESFDSLKECSAASVIKGSYLLSQVVHIPEDAIEPEIPPDLQGPGGHVFLRMLKRTMKRFRKVYFFRENIKILLVFSIFKKGSDL
ncbi:hypothetical protein Gasu2_23010 [Galdieria sulphuraria]|nr:hypothetical protein Gasu2_23010 [Galdieria sulphuraria]